MDAENREHVPQETREPAMSPDPGAGLMRGRLIILAGLVVIAVVARFILAPKPPMPPAYFEIPAFSLTSHDARPFGSADLAGKAWVAGFFFTRCPTICPILLQRQKEVQARTAELGESLQMISISIDPTNDTPERMREHAAQRGLTLERWTMLTGETEPIQQLVRDGFKEYLKAGPDVPVEEIVHSVRFFLVDGRGRVRGLYDGMNEAEIARLVEDARNIIRHPDAPPGA